MKILFWATSLGLLAPQLQAANLQIVDKSEQGLTVLMQTDDLHEHPVQVQSIDDGLKTFSTLVAKNLEPYGKPGHPLIPRKSILVRVPPGKSIEVRTLDVAGKKTIKLNSPLVWEGYARHCGTPQIRNERVYEKNQIETQLVDVGETDFVGHHRGAWVHLQPISYNPLRQNISYTPRLRVRIEFVDNAHAEAMPAPVSRPDPALETLFINAPERGDPLRNTTDLMIYDESYETALSSFIAFRQAAGRTVQVQPVRNPTRDAVHGMIKQAAQSANPPAHVLLIGSIDQIPALRQNGIWTDYYYSLLDSGSKPDISVARIPARTPAQLQAYLVKAQQFIENPNPASAALLTAGRDTSLGCPQNVDRIGAIVEARAADIDVTKLYRVNGATQRQIIDGYNANPNLVVYDGHGDQQGMLEIPLKIQHLPQFTNQHGHILLDIACLNAYWPSSGATSPNFAESTLLMAHHGAAGLVAAGGNSGGHSFFRNIVSKLLEESNGEFGFEEIGQAVLAAEILGSSGDAKMFGYYGDPSLIVFANR